MLTESDSQKLTEASNRLQSRAKALTAAMKQVDCPECRQPKLVREAVNFVNEHRIP